MSMEPHPDSVVCTQSGQALYPKAHRCSWSGTYRENSQAAIQECHRLRVARAEIDVSMLCDADFLVTHDSELERTTTGTGAAKNTTRRQAQELRIRWRDAVSDHRPPLLSDLVAAMSDWPPATLLELDVQDSLPWPWPRVEELARLVEPVKERVVLSGGADWNLRRLLRVDPGLRVGFDPLFYLDWEPPGAALELMPGARGAYGYLDAHPLARQRSGPTADYLWDRFGGLVRLVPGARDIHVRLAMFERMLDDGLVDPTGLLHDQGLLVDVWTLDAETPGWRDRLARAVAAGVDIITSNTPQVLAAAIRAGNW